MVLLQRIINKFCRLRLYLLKMYLLLINLNFRQLMLYLMYLRAPAIEKEQFRIRYLEKRYQDAISKHQSLANINVELIKYHHLEDLYEYVKIMGNFNQILTIKQKLALKASSIKNQVDYFFIALEAGIILPKEKIRKPWGYKIFRLKTFLKKVEIYCILNDQIRHKVRCNTLLQRQFHKEIKGKNILIPGPVYLKASENINKEQYDIQVFPNLYVTNNFIKNWQPEKVNISYFNHYRVRERTTEVLDACRFLDWAVTRSDKGRKKVRASLTEGSDTNVRSLDEKPIFDFVDLMGLQRIILDIMAFEPNKIMITNFTFHVDNLSDYDTGYKAPDIDSSKMQILGALREHDAIGNFAFVKALHQRGVLSCDSEMERILKLSVAEYAANLDKKFSLIGLQ